MEDLSQRRKSGPWRVFALVAVALLLLSATMLLGFEAWRQNAIAAEIETLRAARQRLDKDILGDRTPEVYYRERLPAGRNGWDHALKAMEYLPDLDGMTPGQLAEAGLRDDGTARSPHDLAEFLTQEDHLDLEALAVVKPGEAELRHLLSRSQRVCDAARAAADCDFIAWTPGPGEKNPWEGPSLGVLIRLRVMRVLIARAAAHHMLGDFAGASREALLAVTYAERHLYPVNQAGAMVEAGMRLQAWELAADLAIGKRLSDEVLREPWPAPMKRDVLFERALESDCVFIWSFTQGWTMTTPDPAFDWAGGGSRHPALEHYPKSPLGPINMRRDVGRGLAFLLEQLHAFKSGPDKFKWEMQTALAGDAIIGYDGFPVYCNVCSTFARLHQYQAALRLRQAELESGPLAKHPEALKRVMSDYDDIVAKLDGGDVVIENNKEFFQRLQQYVATTSSILRLPPR